MSGDMNVSPDSQTTCCGDHDIRINPSVGAERDFLAVDQYGRMVHQHILAKEKER